VYDTCAEFSTTEFQVLLFFFYLLFFIFLLFKTDRGRFQENLRESMRKYCEDLYCELNDLQVNNVQRPQLFESAVKDKEAAKENIRVAENERPRLILQAQTEYEQSIKQYEIIINNGTTTARIIKTRLV
jgi:prohibitin 2